MTAHPRSSRITVLVVAGVLVAMTAAASARTWQVPSEAPTIAAGIDSAAYGDVVEVADGAYYEHGLVMKSGITLRSVSGQAYVTIDAGGNGRVMNCSGCDLNTTFMGICFVNGLAQGDWPDDQGGGVYCDDSDPLFEYCFFSDNQAIGSGGGVACNGGSDAHFFACYFQDNQAGDGGPAGGGTGGGLGVWNSSPTVEDCWFLRNESGSFGGAVDLRLSSAYFEDCVLLDNTAGFIGAAARLFSSSPFFMRCTIVGSDARDDGAFSCQNTSSLTLEGCILANALQAPLIDVEGGSSATLTACDLYGNAGGDWVGYEASQQGSNANFRADPGFCDLASGDVSLCADSWCLPGTLPNGQGHGQIGAVGQSCGACGPLVPVEARSWGAVKAGYR